MVSDNPSDPGNLKAARICERLMLDTSAIPADTAAKYLSLYEGDECNLAIKIESEVLRQIGFHSAPPTIAAIMDEVVSGVEWDRD